jgi:hypothetical protein
MRYLLLAILMLPPAVFGQSADSTGSPNALIRNALRQFNANKKEAYAYTYIELWRNQNFNRHGKLRKNMSAGFESIFIDDLPYLRKIQENGKPLTAQAARLENERYEAAVKARRGMTLEQKQAELRFKNLKFPIDLNLLPELYNNRIIGTETLNGRPAIHIDCVPRAHWTAKTEKGLQALNVHVQVWIDVQDQIFSRYDGELLAPMNGMMSGTEASVSFQPIDGIWLPSHTTVQGQSKQGKSIIDFKTELTYSNFQKFRVDVRVLDNDNSGIQAIN